MRITGWRRAAPSWRQPRLHLIDEFERPGWASICGKLAHMADDCDVVMVHDDAGVLVLRYDRSGV